MADSSLALTPQFYINNETWNCHYGSATLSTDSVDVFRGVCAYIPSVEDRVYQCRAPDATCWTWHQTCSGGQPGENIAGPDQVQCENNGVSWCCLKDWEVCSGKQRQTNVCWAASFANPMVGIDLWSDEATISADVVLRQQGLAMATIPPFPSPTPTEISTTATPAVTATGSCAPAANISAILDAEHEKIVNESHARAAIVVTVIGSLIALGLILNAILWGLRVRDRRRDRKHIREISEEDPASSQRSLSAPSPTVAFNKRTSNSSRLSLRERRHSHNRTPSIASDSIEVIKPKMAHSDQLTKNSSKEILITTPSPTVVNSPTSPTAVNSPMSEAHSPVTPSSVAAIVRRSISPLNSPTFTGSKFGSIAEAYDEVPEDPTDLEGYAIYEKGKRESEKPRIGRQHNWMD